MLNKKIFYDISIPLSKDMIVYKNKPEKIPQIDTILKHDTNKIQESRFSLDAHSGTHIDFPLHTIENGKSSNDYTMDAFMGKCQVLDLTFCLDSIKDTDLSKFNIREGEIILLKTQSTISNTFDFNFIYLSESGARYLAEKNIKAVGIDQLGIERNQTDHITHNILLNQDILIYEGLNLSQISQDYYEFIGFPISIKNVEASLVRAVLIQNKKVILSSL